MAHQWPRYAMKGKFDLKKCRKLWLTIPTQSFHFTRYFTIKSDELFSILSLSEPLVERRAIERGAKLEIQKMNA
jgi:hypothetical protein